MEKRCQARALGPLLLGGGKRQSISLVCPDTPTSFRVCDEKFVLIGIFKILESGSDVLSFRNVYLFRKGRILPECGPSV